MGYALFAQKKLVLCGLINSVQMQQAERSNEQLKLATNTMTLQSKMAKLQQNQAVQLSEVYEKLSNSVDGTKLNEMQTSSLTGDEFAAKYFYDKSKVSTLFNRQSIDDQIKIIQKQFEAEIDGIDYQIKMTSLKENSLEMEVKKLDTRLTALQQQLEKIEDAEGKGIEKATPKFSGIG